MIYYNVWKISNEFGSKASDFEDSKGWLFRSNIYSESSRSEKPPMLLLCANGDGFNIQHFKDKYIDNNNKPGGIRAMDIWMVSYHP